MNIFYLDFDTKVCAQMHNDKHCVKMILEYAQLLSTAHRVLDGKEIVEKREVPGSSPVRYRNVKKWKLNDDRDSNLYSATHINHPSAIWARDCAANYRWLFNLWLELMDEYTYRYGKQHACGKLISYLAPLPTNISTAKQFYSPTPAMPEEIKVNFEDITGKVLTDSKASYRNYYIRSKTHLASWKKRDVPLWYQEGASILLKYTQ